MILFHEAREMNRCSQDSLPQLRSNYPGRKNSNFDRLPGKPLRMVSTAIERGVRKKRKETKSFSVSGHRKLIGVDLGQGRNFRIVNNFPDNINRFALRLMIRPRLQLGI